MTLLEQIQTLKEKRKSCLKAIGKNVFLFCFSGAVFFGALLLATLSGNLIGALLLSLVSILIPSFPFIRSLRQTGGIFAAFRIDSTKIAVVEKKKNPYASIGSAASALFLRISLYFVALCGGFFLLLLCIVWQLMVLLKISLTLLHLNKKQATEQTPV